MDESKKVSLRKKGWTDPETGEYYPGGNPNEISKSLGEADSQSSSFSKAQSSPFPEFNSVRDNEIYPNQSDKDTSYAQNNTQTAEQTPGQALDPSVHIEYNDGKKFCKFCGKRIVMDAVVCTYCGRQVELLRTEPNPNPSPESDKQQQTVVVNRVTVSTKPRNRWVSLFLCILLGAIGIHGIHRFYEGKFKTGLLWMFTFGLLGIGWITDIVKIASLNNKRYYIDNKGKRRELK